MDLETDINTSPVRVAKVQLATLLLMALANILLYLFLASEPVTAPDQLAAYKWKLLEQQNEATDLLILGGSSAAFAINPDTLEERSGHRVLNLASSARLLALHDAWMLHAYIEKGGPPQTVLLMRHRFWGASLRPSALATVPLPWGFWDRFEPPAPLSSQQRRELWWDKFVPLYTRPLPLAIWLRPWRQRLSLGELTSSGGIQLNSGSEMRFQEKSVRRWSATIKEPFFLSAANEIGLESLQRTCEEHGITLYFVNPPIWEGDGETTYYQEMEERLGTYASASLMSGPVAYSSSQMYDGVHLRPAAAQEFTERLSRELLEEAGGAR